MAVSKVILLLFATIAITAGRTPLPPGGGTERHAGCQVCPPGFGVVTMCTKLVGTKCAPCPQGTYSPGYTATEPCTPCSTCPSGFYQRTPCIDTQDVTCKACFHSNNAYGNENFLRQCETTTVTTTTTSTTTTPTTTLETSTRTSSILLSKISATPSSTSAEDGVVRDTSSQGEEDGSGDVDSVILGSENFHTQQLDKEELLPVKTTIQTPKSSRSSTTSIGPSTESHIDQFHAEGPRMGEAKGDDQQSGGFEWPILLAAVTSALVFFVLGILVSMICKKSVHGKSRSAREQFGEDSVQTAMIQPAGNDYTT